MAVTRQLFQLQEIDQEIESAEKSLAVKNSQLGETQALIEARNKTISEKQRLDDLRKQQKSLEWEIDDLSAKIKTGDGKLYGGRIGNPKELSSLQQEITSFKAKRDQLETQALGIIDEAERTDSSLVVICRDFSKMELEWRSRQELLAGEIAALQEKIAARKQERQELAQQIEPAPLSLYEKLRKQKALAVAIVAQGICQGCRISMSSSHVQQVRGGNLVQCSSCGRILFLP